VTTGRLTTEEGLELNATVTRIRLMPDTFTGMPLPNGHYITFAPDSHCPCEDCQCAIKWACYLVYGLPLPRDRGLG
jgi:hypothetical protein